MSNDEKVTFRAPGYVLQCCHNPFGKLGEGFPSGWPVAGYIIPPLFKVTGVKAANLVKGQAFPGAQADFPEAAGGHGLQPLFLTNNTGRANSPLQVAAKNTAQFHAGQFIPQAGGLPFAGLGQGQVHLAYKTAPAVGFNFPVPYQVYFFLLHQSIHRFIFP
jgi:hypothetical protein